MTLLTSLARFFALVGLASISEVEAQELHYQEETQNYWIVLHGEGGVLLAKNTTLSGGGVRVDFNYATHERFGLSFGMAQALGWDAGLIALYTAFHGHLIINLTSHALQSKDFQVQYGSDVVIRGKKRNPFRFFTSVGVDQFFLNATSSIVPMTGIGASLNLEFELFSDWMMSLGVRSGLMLLGNDSQVIPIMGKVGIVW